MGINVRQKGAEGEREVIRALEPIVRKVYAKLGIQAPDKNILQRNQNQSSVGGSDLTNTFGLAIEIKRQEDLAINAWWAQACTAASRNNETPILLYRQNGKKWQAMMFVWTPLPAGRQRLVRAQITWDDFLEWFEEWVTGTLRTEFAQLPRV